MTHVISLPHQKAMGWLKCVPPKRNAPGKCRRHNLGMWVTYRTATTVRQNLIEGTLTNKGPTLPNKRLDFWSTRYFYRKKVNSCQYMKMALMDFQTPTQFLHNHKSRRQLIGSRRRARCKRVKREMWGGEERKWELSHGLKAKLQKEITEDGKTSANRMKFWKFETILTSTTDMVSK